MSIVWTEAVPILHFFTTPPPIFGVSWDKGSSPTLTRTDAAVGMTAAVGVLGGVAVANSFNSAPIFSEIVEVTDTLGNVFVRIPKFYIKKTSGATYTLQISKKQYPGFYLPAVFWDFTNSRELPYFDFGKYKASKAATKLQSVAGVYPLVSDTIVNFRTYARANNTGGLLGYQQFDVHAHDVLSALFTVEFATLDSQSIMQGLVGGTAAWQNGFATGPVSGYLTANSGLYPCAYRGIESPWGDVWQFVDGVNFNNRQAWVTPNAENYASNVFASPYVQLGYVNGSTDGYSMALGFDANYPYAEFPTAVGGSASTYYADYYYQATSLCIARVGGHWNDGSYAGLRFWGAFNASSSAGASIGGRLLRKPL